jgi:small subunit ribosomal protein S9
MADDEKTVDETPETPEASEEQAQEPVAEEPAAPEEQPAAEAPAEEQPEAEEPAAEEEAPAEESAPVAEEPAREEAPAKEEPKKDVIPGADLEPIAVEPEAPQLSAEERARLEAEEEEKARREAELAAAEAESDAASRAPAKMEAGARFLATGKRKSSIARVTLMPGDGKFTVNGRELAEFFPRPLHQTMAQQPLAVTGYEGNVDVRVRVHGGGISGQAGAVRHGVARALTEIDAELRGDLKRRGFLTRDARVKERRKAGLKKARKRPQFSKR